MSALCHTIVHVNSHFLFSVYQVIAIWAFIVKRTDTISHSDDAAGNSYFHLLNSEIWERSDAECDSGSKEQPGAHPPFSF